MHVYRKCGNLMTNLIQMLAQSIMNTYTLPHTAIYIHTQTHQKHRSGEKTEENRWQKTASKLQWDTSFIRKIRCEREIEATKQNKTAE